MTSANVGWINVDLNDGRPARIELAPSEIRSEQEQYITVKDGMIACGGTENARHANVVRVVGFEEVLATRRVDHWGLQSRCRSDHLVMRVSAARPAIDRDRFTLVENGRDLIEIRVARANERTPRMNSIRSFF